MESIVTVMTITNCNILIVRYHFINIGKTDSDFAANIFDPRKFCADIIPSFILPINMSFQLRRDLF